MSTWGTSQTFAFFWVISSNWAGVACFLLWWFDFLCLDKLFMSLGTNFSIFCIHLWLCAAKIVSVCDKAVAFSLSKLRFKIPLFLKNCRIINVCGIIQITFPQFHWYVPCFFSSVFDDFLIFELAFFCIVRVGNSLGSSCSSWKYRIPFFQLFFFGKHF